MYIDYAVQKDELLAEAGFDDLVWVDLYRCVPWKTLIQLSVLFFLHQADWLKIAGMVLSVWWHFEKSAYSVVPGGALLDFDRD